MSDRTPQRSSTRKKTNTPKQDEQTKKKTPGRAAKKEADELAPITISNGAANPEARRKARKRKLFADTSPPPSSASNFLEAPIGKKKDGKAGKKQKSNKETPVSPSPAISTNLSTTIIPAKLRGKIERGKEHLQLSPSAASLGPSIEAPAPQRLHHFISQNNTKKWMTYEWFYSNIDFHFFDKNEFQESMNHLGLGHVTKLTAGQWNKVRRALGSKPRRLSAAFLHEERVRLHRYRDNVVAMRNGKAPQIAEEGDWIPTVLPLEPAVKSTVLAYNKTTKTIEKGEVAAYFPVTATVTVHFDNIKLGEQSIPEHDIMIIGRNTTNFSSSCPTSIWARSSEDEFGSPIKRSLNQSPSAPHSSSVLSSPVPSYQPYTTEDIRSLASLLRLLELKEKLLNRLHMMNDRAEQFFQLQQNGIHEKSPVKIEPKPLEMNGNHDDTFGTQAPEMVIDEGVEDSPQKPRKSGGSSQNGSPVKDLEVEVRSPTFQQQFAWLIIQLDETNRKLEPTLRKLHEQTFPKKSSHTMTYDPSTSYPDGLLREVLDKCKKNSQYPTDSPGTSTSDVPRARSADHKLDSTPQKAVEP